MFECYSCSPEFDKRSFCGSSSEWERQGWSWGGRCFQKEEGHCQKILSWKTILARWRQGKDCLNKWSPESHHCFLHRRKVQAGFRKSEWKAGLLCHDLGLLICQLIKVFCGFNTEACRDSVMKGEPWWSPSPLRKFPKKGMGSPQKGVCGKPIFRLSFFKDQKD